MPFSIILHEPEIPNNTGNIGRTAIATGCDLHLVHPLGFDTSEKALRRAGLDYWPRLAPREHATWQAYEQACTTGPAPSLPPRRWFFTTKSTRSVYHVPFQVGDHLVFGKETKGLPDSMLEQYRDQLVTFPMVPGERSLNLATAVCAAIYLGVGRILQDQAILGEAANVRLDGSGRLLIRRDRPAQT
jgi:tRNA (cytidine/uridine-2'-O-)-methyltransferase